MAPIEITGRVQDLLSKRQFFSTCLILYAASPRNTVSTYLINQTPREKLRHGVALRASAALVKSCELLSQLDHFTLVW